MASTGVKEVRTVDISMTMLGVYIAIAFGAGAYLGTQKIDTPAEAATSTATPAPVTTGAPAPGK